MNKFILLTLLLVGCSARPITPTVNFIQLTATSGVKIHVNAKHVKYIDVDKDTHFTSITLINEDRTECKEPAHVVASKVNNLR